MRTRIRLLVFALSGLALSFALCGCRLEEFLDEVTGGISEKIFMDDLGMARQAQAKRDWPLAERVLGRYLREERDPEKRWEAWNLLLQTINAASQEPRASLECLDVMLVEYEDDEARLAPILEMIGQNNLILRDYGRAANAWSAYADLPSLEPLERIRGLRQLARAQLAQRHFEAAEETLQQCLSLPLPDHDKVWCMLDMADAAMGRQQWENVADMCQQILDSEPDREVSGLTGYYLGDALEQMGRQAEALKVFERARDSYPNPAVMDNRIEYLKKQLKTKK